MKSIDLFKPVFCSAAILFASVHISNAANLYWAGGTTDITDGTAIPTLYSSLNGTWNSSTKNFATNTSGTTYQAWTDGSSFSASFGGFAADFVAQTSTVTLASNVSLPGMSFGLGLVGAGGNKRVAINAASAQTITLSGTAPTIDVRANGTSLGLLTTAGLDINGSGTNVTLAGSNGFTKTGNYALRIFGTQNSITGTVNLVHNANLDNGNSPGMLSIGANNLGAGTLAGITRFNVSGINIGTANGPAGGGSAYGNTAKLIVSNGSVGQNQLNDSAVINLGGIGIFEYWGRTGATETMGSLRLGSSGVLSLSSNVGAGNVGTLNITNGIDRSNNRAQLVVTTDGTGNMTSTVNLGSSHGLGTSLLPWAADGTRGRFMSVNGSNNLAFVSQTDVTNVSTIISSTIDYRVTGDSTQLTNTTFASGAAANSLGFYRGTNTNPVTVNITDTLSITSGGISVGNDGNNTQVTIQGGTSLSTSAAALYVSTGYSGSGGTVAINTPVTGNIDFAKTGNSDFQFGGSVANSYTGTTYVNGGTMILNKTAGVASIAGNVVVRTGGTLVLNTANQIADSASLSVENGGYFNSKGLSETVANLSGGGMILAEGGNGTTTVTGAVTIGDGGIGTMINNRVGTSSVFQMNSGAVYNFELAGNGATSDMMAFYNFSSNAEFVRNNNAINLTLSGAQTGGTYTVSLFKFYSDNGSTLTSSNITSGFSIGSLGSGITGTPTLNYNSGGNSIDLTFTVVPEPATWALLAFSLTTVMVFRRRSKA